METLEAIGGVIAFLIYAYLLWQQNRIMEEQNELMRQQGGTARRIANESSWRRRHWPMLVMAALTVMTWGGIAFLLLRSADVQQWQHGSMETVYAKTFINETVEIDGKKFDHCTFQNVKLLFHGTAPSEVVGGKFSGTIYVGSDNIAIREFMDLNKKFSESMILQGDWLEFDKNGNLMQYSAK